MRKLIYISILLIIPIWAFSQINFYEMYDTVCPSGSTIWEDYDCAKHYFTYWSAIGLTDTNDYDEVVYIDPTVGDGGDGTFSDPYNEWTDFTICGDTAYVQKRGTTYTSSATINIPSGKDSIYIGAYGSGAKPIIQRSIIGGEVLYVYSPYCVIADLDLRNANDTVQADILRLSGGGASDYTFIYNCNLTYGQEGIINYSDQVRVVACTFRHIYKDPIWAGQFNYMEISHCHIDTMNTIYRYYQTNEMAGGDGIQYGDDWYETFIHHDTIDRSIYANKSCLQLESAADPDPIRSIIGFNVLIGPPDNGNEGSSINYDGGLNFTICYNKLIGVEGSVSKNTGIYQASPNGEGDSIYGNVFENYHTAIYGGYSDQTEIAHNTFYGNDTIARDVRANWYYNIFSNYSHQSLINPYVTAEDGNLFTGSVHGSFSNSYHGDAAYTDSLNGDFSLTSVSEAIDSASVLGYWEFDILDNPQSGLAWDVGAYEYQQHQGDYFMIKNYYNRFKIGNAAENYFKIYNTE